MKMGMKRHTYAHTLTVFQREGVTLCMEEWEGFMNTDRIKNAAEVVSLASAKFEINFLARGTSLGMLTKQ